MYSLKKELADLSESAHVFGNFEKEAARFDRDLIEDVKSLAVLMKIRKLSSEIKHKSSINEKLNALHFSISMLSNSSGAESLKKSFGVFFSSDAGVANIVSELNDFKSKLEQLSRHHAELLPKSLDNKMRMDEKYGKHIEQLHIVRERQKKALVSAMKLFMETAKKRIASLKKFK